MDVTLAAKTSGAIAHYSSRISYVQRSNFYKTKKTRFAVKAHTSRESGRPSMVDEDMFTLRKRIQQIRMEERNYVEWEEKRYPSYCCSGVYSTSLGWLRKILLNTRVGIAVAFLALIWSSGPASLLLLLIQSPIVVKRATLELLAYLRR